MSEMLLLVPSASICAPLPSHCCRHHCRVKKWCRCYL